jgi:arylsulfatase A-like enzyme
MDITLRTDRMLADFFAFLERRIGLRNCTILLTADHGVAPIPERLKAMSPTFSAGRVDNVRLLRTCEAALDRAFGPLSDNRHWLIVDENNLLFMRDVLKEKNIAQAAAENVVRDALLTIDFVAAAATRSDLLAGKAAGEFATATLLSFNAARSGDLYYQMKPYWVDRKNGTNHGSPYAYDAHVPLVWYGVGVRPGVYAERVSVDDIAPTLANLLGIMRPPLSQGRVLFARP